MAKEVQEADVSKVVSLVEEVMVATYSVPPVVAEGQEAPPVHPVGLAARRT